MSIAEILVAVAQVAAGGTIVQGVVALVRRRSELRKLDREAEAVAVETADRLLVMVRAELDETRQQLQDERRTREQAQRHVTLLGDQLAQLRMDLVVARAELASARERPGITGRTNWEAEDG